ncbi:hypothetical protein [Nonomuraea typhae]|uniref:hypothetical protein n=1 Tax=Nonomuraea typhae TaxID=2603600 RepID=UPI0012FB2558|nr:hypothetical protein [Nonomuraea typhae]
MASPLQHGDPPHLGPFTVQARLHVLQSGFVYLAQARDGRAVSLAVLTRGAALDAAARDRFVTAVRESAPAARRGWFGRATVLDSPPQVLAMDAGPAPWVAVPYQPGRPGAERFLEPVMVGGMLIGQAHGPDFVPYWLRDSDPALPGAPGAPRPLTETARRVLLALAVLVALLLLGVVIALVLLIGRQDSDPPPQPLPPTLQVPTPPPTPATPEPSEPSPSPSPSTSGPGTPGPSQGDDSGEEDPI